MSKSKIVITDHAVVRYLERVIGVDVDALKREIVNEETAKIINRLKTLKISTPTQAKLVVVDKTVVTVVKK